MTPAIVSRRISAAKAVSANLREVAREVCGTPGAAARFIQAAQTIDEMVALLESATFVAKLNHDTIVAGART